MSEEITIRNHQEYLEKFSQKFAELKLLAKGDGTEVLIQKIQTGETTFINPSHSDSLMEFFYILEGKVKFKNEDKIIEKGDYFYTNNLSKVIKFDILEDVTLMYISTKPVFHYISETMNKLKEISKESQRKDMYTHDHGDRVQEYSLKIASKLNLSDETVENIAFAALLHDIGKINVPNEILKKPGKLTKEEFDYIKKHPIDGKDMIEKTYYRDVGKVIEQHHERLDGSGYPKGLKGHEICIEAKIIAVADSFDAMTSDRPYRKGMEADEALMELKELSGKHYDSEIVEIFEDVLKECKIIE